MKVLNVQLKHIHGGNPQVCLDYSRVLKKAGNEVFVLTNPLDPFIERHLDFAEEVFASEKIGNHGSYDLLSVLYFRKIIKQVKPDVILVHEGRSAALIKHAVGKKIPVIDVNHGRSPKQSKRMDASIVTNSFQIKKYHDFLGDNFPVFYVPNSIDTDGCEAPKIPRDWQSPPVIGTIGRFVVDKALDVFVDALAILDKKGVDFSVKMAGEGEERDALTQKINEYNLQSKVQMPGWVKKPEDFYKAIDIFCFPSRKEEFGLVLLEAYKYGLPAVVSDAEGPSDIAENEVDALVVPKENAEELAGALHELLQNKEKADGLAAKGNEKLLAKYSVEKVAEQLQSVLEEVVKFNKNQKVA